REKSHVCTPRRRFRKTRGFRIFMLAAQSLYLQDRRCPVLNPMKPIKAHLKAAKIPDPASECVVSATQSFLLTLSGSFSSQGSRCDCLEYREARGLLDSHPQPLKYSRKGSYTRLRDSSSASNYTQ